MANVSLVHLSKYEARRVLEPFAGVLRPGGKLYACVHALGETGWCDEQDGRRSCTFWTLKAFVAVVEAAGLVVNDADVGAVVVIWATRPGAPRERGGVSAHFLPPGIRAFGRDMVPDDIVGAVPPPFSPDRCRAS